ncbi:hypothetical protein HK103_000887 [Boothiomyces macroporosus]|uniref:Uncharacterized protein n=1 Tax=Boothiomyces macroporosus TaxID=261099 RepID=A0AAD5UMR6_9FUNG|nr:hypothetical protein HK103_000887 [Boothiomyces macroporosus]
MVASTGELEAQAAAKRKQMRRGILKMIMMNIVFPIIIYSVLEGKVSLVLALALSGIPPALEGLENIWKNKKVDAIAAIVILSIVFSIVVVLLTSDPKLILLKDSIQTVFFGIGFGGSVFMSENIIWRYQRQFAGSDPDVQANLDLQYANPKVREVTNFMCVIWAIGFFVEAGIRVTLIYTIPTAILGYLSPIILLVVLGSLGIWSYWYARYTRRKFLQESHE